MIWLDIWYQSGSVIVLLLHWVTAFSKVNKLQRLWRNYFSQYLWHSFQQTEPNVSKLQVNDELTEKEGLSWLGGERPCRVGRLETTDVMEVCLCPASRHPVALPSLLSSRLEHQTSTSPVGPDVGWPTEEYLDNYPTHYTGPEARLTISICQTSSVPCGGVQPPLVLARAECRLPHHLTVHWRK